MGIAEEQRWRAGDKPRRRLLGALEIALQHRVHEAQGHEQVGNQIADRRLELVGYQVAINHRDGLQDQLVKADIEGEDEPVGNLQRVIDRDIVVGRPGFARGCRRARGQNSCHQHNKEKMAKLALYHRHQRPLIKPVPNWRRGAKQTHTAVAPAPHLADAALTES